MSEKDLILEFLKWAWHEDSVKLADICALDSEKNPLDDWEIEQLLDKWMKEKNVS